MPVCIICIWYNIIYKYVCSHWITHLVTWHHRVYSYICLVNYFRCLHHDLITTQDIPKAAPHETSAVHEPMKSQLNWGTNLTKQQSSGIVSDTYLTRGISWSHRLSYWGFLNHGYGSNYLAPCWDCKKHVGLNNHTQTYQVGVPTMGAVMERHCKLALGDDSVTLNDWMTFGKLLEPILVYFGLFWFILVIFWFILVYIGYILVYVGLFWYILVIFWFMLVYFGIYWLYFGLCWLYFGIFWSYLFLFPSSRS